MSDKTLSRKDLYNLVWSKPLTTLAEEFSYSDNGLRKICKKHNIPLPKAGYWMKVKHNKKVTIIDLPKGDDTTNIQLNAKDAINENSMHPNSARAIIKNEIENNKQLKLTVPDKLKNLDQLIKEAKADLKDKKPSLWHNHQNLIHTSPGIISIAISKSNIARALLFMDTLIKLIKKRGHKIKIDNGTYIVINEEELKVRLKEFTKRIKIEESNSSWDRYEFIPSGELSFRVESYPEKIWRDGKTSSIELQLSRILSTLELRAKKQKEQRIENEIQHQLYQAQRAKEEAYKLLKEEELANFNNLFQSATRWHKSQYIRNYINEFKVHAIKTNTLDKAKTEWINWAREKADWYDPFIEKEVELLKNVDKNTLEHKKYRY